MWIVSFTFRSLYSCGEEPLISLTWRVWTLWRKDKSAIQRHPYIPHLHLSSLRLNRYQFPRVLRRRCAAACLLRLWVRIPPGACMFVCCEYCVLSGRGICNELITLPEESYRLWCVVVCDLETSRMRRHWSTGGGGCRAKNKQTNKKYD